MGKITAHLKNILDVTTFYTGNMFLCHKINIQYKYTMKRRNIWEQCFIYKQIFLPPKIVVFPLELVDEIILHEMSHLKFMHHRKQFWEYFSFLQGRDAKLCKMKESVFFAKYDEMIEFLLK